MARSRAWIEALPPGPKVRMLPPPNTITSEGPRESIVRYNFAMTDVVAPPPPWPTATFPPTHAPLTPKLISQAAYKHFVYQTGEDEFESLPEFDLLPQEQWAEAAPADVSMYMNHSCDPTSWFEFEHPGWVDGPGVMTARRDIAQVRASGASTFTV